MQNKSVTVVMYHYVREIKNSKYPDIKGLEVSDFILQMQYFEKNYNFIDMQELFLAIDGKQKLPKNALLLTFDDGYKDHYEFVLPILEKFKAKGAFYIPASVIENFEVLDVNKIHYILASSDEKEVIKEIKTLLKKYNDDNFEEYYKELAYPRRFDNKDVMFIKRLLQAHLPENLRKSITNDLFKKFVKEDEKEFSKKLYMSEKEIRELKNLGHHLGSHGYDHYWWTKLSDAKLQNELELSLNFLKKFDVDILSWSACYPYGHHDNKVMEILKNKGCKVAFTVEPKVGSIEEDLLKFPRLDTNDLPKK